MVRQRGWVQLEQSNMRLALITAKMPKGGFSCAAIGETQFLIMKPRAEVREEKKQGAELPGYNNVKIAMEIHPAMLQENLMDGCLPCQNGAAQDPQTRWRPKGTGAPPPERVSQPTPELTPNPPGTPLAPPDNSEAAHVSEIDGVPPGHVYIHTPLPSTQFLNLDAYAKDRKCDKDFNPDLLTDEGTSTG